MVSNNGKPKIVLAASIYPPDPGGPALHAKKMYEWLNANGWENEIVKLSKFRLLPIGLRHFAYLASLWRKAKEAGVVYAYDAFGVGLPAMLVAKLRRKKFVIRIGGDIPWERSSHKGKTDLSLKEWYKAGEHKKNFAYKISRFVMRRADAIVVPSTLLSELYMSQYGIRSDKLHVISNPAPEKVKDFSSDSDYRDFIFASRLVPYKNLGFVLDAMSHVLPDYPDTRFVIMGDGPERKILEARTRALGISNQVLFTGSISQEEVLKETDTCYAGIAPALTEFNPNYILECLSRDKPFLISNENGLPFRIPEVLIFDPRNQSDFEDKLRYLLSPEGYQEAKRLVENIDFQMSWDEVIESNLELIKGL